MPMTEKDIADQIKVLTSQLGLIKDQCKLLEDELKRLEMEREEIKMKELKEEKEKEVKEHQCKCQQLAVDDWRIIHLKENPVDNRINRDWEHYRFLKAENKKLATRLELIEAGQHADITRMVNEEINYSSEIERLKIALQISESKRGKYIEECKKTIKELKEAFSSLTGCRIEFTSNGYKVSFLYAENQASDLLLFKMENKELELLENDFSKSLKTFVHRYLVQHDSYPAFIAAITLHLFKKSFNVE